MVRSPMPPTDEDCDFDCDCDCDCETKQNIIGGVFFYFPSSITIKLKCFSNIIVIGSFNRISDIL